MDIFVVRKLADIQFRSLCQLLDLLRQRELRDIPMCKELWDLLPVNFMSFRWSCVDAVQIEILLRLFEKGELLSPIFTWQTELRKATTRQPKTTIRIQCVMVVMMHVTCHPVISMFSFTSTVQLIYVHRRRRHLNVTGSCRAKQRRILKFAVDPFQNSNLTILELKAYLEVCTLSFLKHMVTWKKLKRVLKRRSPKMEEMLFPK